MEMHVVAVPLYNGDMAVEAYVFRYHKGNAFVTSVRAAGLFDGASHSDLLEVLELVGLEAFTLGKPIFVPINYIQLLGNLHTQCSQPPDKVIFLFEDTPPNDDTYLAKIEELAALGFRFAATNLNPSSAYGTFLRYCSHIFLSQREERMAESAQILAELRKDYPQIQPVALHVRSREMMRQLQGTGYQLYESRFFKVAINQGDNKVSPLKANSIRLMNSVQDDNFDFEKVTEIVQGDPALTISLLQIVNARSQGPRNEIKTISQAVSMMGQQEVRKWVTTAVSRSLGNDKPNEITRISLIRAKFAENLAPLYELAHASQGLFLMGLFSVLDIILDVPMEEALRVVRVSDLIRGALVDKSGSFYPVLTMVLDYEGAFWSSISRQMIVGELSQEALSDAYMDALIWYKNLTLTT